MIIKFKMQIVVIITKKSLLYYKNHLLNNEILFLIILSFYENFQKYDHIYIQFFYNDVCRNS